MNRRSASKRARPTTGLTQLGITLGFGCCFALLTEFAVVASQEPKESKSSLDRNLLSEKISSTIRTINEEKSPAVVRIRSNDGRGEIVGTGFYIDPTGTICTLAEIVEGGRNITIEQEGRTLPATLLAVDPRSGIAFLKATEENAATNFLPAVPGTNSPALTPVIGIGYPREQQTTPVLGMITGSKNHEGSFYYCVTHMVASMPLTEGEGGTPVLDLSGNLLGIVTSGNTQMGLCTILPSAAIEQLHHNLLRFGNLNPGWVGAVVEFAAVPQKESRTRVSSIDPGSPAETAGLQPGDTLLMLGNRTVHTPEDVLEASFYLTAGEPIEITIWRGGSTRKLTLVCKEKPETGDDLATNASAEPTASLGAFGH